MSNVIETRNLSRRFGTNPTFPVRRQKRLFSAVTSSYSLCLLMIMFQNGLWGRPSPLTIFFILRQSSHVPEVSQSAERR